MANHSQVQILEIRENSDGQRLDNFLFRELKGLPKSRVYRLIRKGEVRINRKRSKPDSKLSIGDMVRIPPIRLPEKGILPKPGADLSQLLKGSILFENDQFIVVNKPSGISVHGGTGVRLGLIEALRQLKPDWVNVELAHRLDRDTSGCMIVAKDPAFLKTMHTKLKQKSVKKTYLALVHGLWPDTLVVVDAPLIKNHLQSGERMVKVASDGKSSITEFEVLERFGQNATLVKAMPVTGRTHQIRVHCQSQGHPIIGDPKYVSSKLASDFPGIKKLCLHAARLEFESDGTNFIFEAPLNHYISEQLDTLRQRT